MGIVTWYVGGTEVVYGLHTEVVLMVTSTSIAFVVLILRLYTRAVVVRKVGADDYLMAMAIVLSIATDVGGMYQIRYGMGRPIDPATVKDFLHWLFATFAIYLIAQTLYKLSIAVQSYRLFCTVTGKRVITALIAWIIVCGIMTFCGSTFYCFPVAKAWDESIEGWCVDRAKIYYSAAAFNILNDIFLVAIPFPFLITLQVAQKQKIVLYSVFACGVIVTVVSIVRLKSLYDMENDDMAHRSISVVGLCLWSHLELNLAIICGSVPALKAFVSRVILRHRSGISSSSGHSSERERNRNQGRQLHSVEMQDEESGRVVGIRVEQSIEMKSDLAVADDARSTKELIVQEPPDTWLGSGNSITVEGPRRTGFYGGYPHTSR